MGRKRKKRRGKEGEDREIFNDEKIKNGEM
jgi:hypothetical protein